jgi:alcohol dehydrogenase (NADP+)
LSAQVPDSFPLEATGPVLCAGITMYSPLRVWGAIAGGKRVGIIGVGGLGQMGIRLAKAMGNRVVAISTSPAKEAAALAMGADAFIVSAAAESLAAAAKSLDLILNTVSADHDINPYLPLLARDVTFFKCFFSKMSVELKKMFV